MAVLIWFSLFFLVSEGESRSFYVSSEAGDNSYNGRSEATPWKDLSKVHWGAFQCGSVFEGHCFIVSSATGENSIVLTSYGEGMSPELKNSGEWSNCIEIRGEEVMPFPSGNFRRMQMYQLKTSVGVVKGQLLRKMK